MGPIPRGYHLVGHHLIYAVLDDVCRRPRHAAESAVDDDESCSTFGALQEGFLLPAPVEVICESRGGREKSGGELAVYIATQVAGTSVTLRVSIASACSFHSSDLTTYLITATESRNPLHVVTFWFLFLFLFFYRATHYRLIECWLHHDDDDDDNDDDDDA